MQRRSSVANELHDLRIGNIYRATSCAPRSREASVVSQRGGRACSVDPTENLGEWKEINPNNIVFGRNNRGAENSHVFVFEFGNRKKIRRYALHNKKYWRCMTCLKEGTTVRAIFTADNKLYVKRNHTCPAIDYAQVQKYPGKIMADLPRREASIAKVPLKTAIIPANCGNNLNLGPWIFNYPSSVWLKEQCTLLNVEFSRDAYVFWGEINIDKIIPTSTANQCSNATTEFGCFANFFTGNTDNATQEKIQKEIRKLFVQNHESLGNFEGFATTKNDVKAEIVLSEKMTPYHFEVMARLMSCRIGMFIGKEFKMFGTTIEKDAITMLLLKDKDEYRIVLSLK